MPVSARAGWPWNGKCPGLRRPGRVRGLKVGSGASGFGDGSGMVSSWWLQGWFQRPVPGVGAGWFRAGVGASEQVPWAEGFRDMLSRWVQGQASVCVGSGSGGVSSRSVSRVRWGWFRGGFGGRYGNGGRRRTGYGRRVWGCQERPEEGRAYTGFSGRRCAQSLLLLLIISI